MDSYRQKFCDVEAEQITASKPFPVYVKRAVQTFNKEIIAYVDYDGMSHPVWEGDWLLYRNRKPYALIRDKTFKEQFVKVETPIAGE